MVYNGLWDDDFVRPILQNDATDFLFVGEMRELKGIDILFTALASNKSEALSTLTLVGDGPDLAQFRALATKLQLSTRVRFVGRKTITEALTMGRILVLPSRNESFPYVVLEAVAASVPVIASQIGGIPEILPADAMFPAENTAALAQLLDASLVTFDFLQAKADTLSTTARSKFGAKNMAEQVTSFYQNQI